MIQGGTAIVYLDTQLFQFTTYANSVKGLKCHILTVTIRLAHAILLIDNYAHLAFRTGT